MGDMADQVKGEAASRASGAMDQAERVASDVTQKVASVVSEVHDVARDRVVEEARQYRTTGAESPTRPH